MSEAQVNKKRKKRKNRKKKEETKEETKEEKRLRLQKIAEAEDKMAVMELHYGEKEADKTVL